MKWSQNLISGGYGRSISNEKEVMRQNLISALFLPKFSSQRGIEHIGHFCRFGRSLFFVITVFLAESRSFLSVVH